MQPKRLRPLLLCTPLLLGLGEVMAANCVYINSYLPGYEWSDRIQHQFEQDIQAQCRITTHYLDAKHETADQLSQKGKEIANLIELAKPDLVIAADDAASAYVVQPFLRNTRTPVVYVGINWDPRPYGYPMDNATGMTELWPTEEIFRILHHTVKHLVKLTVISADNPLEKTDSFHIEQTASRHNVEVEHLFVRRFSEWKQAVIKAQTADAIHLGTNQSIADWNEEEAIAWLKQHNKRFTFASQDFMRPYVMFSLSKSPEEFGHWAAELSKAILGGLQPWQIPIVPNHRFIPYINTSLLSLTAYELPAYLKRNAINFQANPQ